MRSLFVASNVFPQSNITFKLKLGNHFDEF